MSAFYDLSKTPRNLNQAIVRAIVSENNGAWFDPSDLSTLFQDAAGTIPVTAVEQPVGKMLDKSGNGNHATQSVTASRPTLSARYNLLTNTASNLATATGWTTNGNITGVLQTDGSSLISRVTTSNAFVNFAISLPVGTTTTLSAKIKKGSVGNLYAIRVLGTYPNRADAVFNMDTGTVAFCGGTTYTGVSATISTPDSDGFYAVTLTSTSVNSAISLVGHGPAAIATANWEGAASTICNDFIKTPQLVIGTTSGQYQRVNTATDYDTDERYFKKYLRFNGVDDYLNLPYMGLYGGRAASIICARDAVSQTTDTYIISERSATDADPKYFPSRQLANAGNMDAYITDDAGAVVLDTIGSAFSGASDKVIRSIVDSGNNLKLFKNGALAANDNYTRAGTLTLNNTTIGASVSTTTGNYASMELYGLIITKSALTDAQRLRCERFLARKAGVML